MSKTLASRLNYNGPRQIYCPNPILIASVFGTNDKPAISPRIRVPIPDCRCRVKITIMFVPADGTANPNFFGAGNTIWIAAYDENVSGGGGGRTVPVTDIEGTSAAPTAFPQSSGLLGYSREFVTSADWIEVVLSLGTSASVGSWVAQTQIQPDVLSFDWDEWDAIRRAFQPVPAGPRGTLWMEAGGLLSRSAARHSGARWPGTGFSAGTMSPRESSAT